MPVTSTWQKAASTGKEAPVSNGDKHTTAKDKSVKAEREQTAKENKPKVLGGNNLSMFQRSTSLSCKRPGRSGLFSKPLPAKQSQSGSKRLRNKRNCIIPESIGCHAVNKEDDITRGSVGDSKETPSSQKHVTFTQEAIQTDLLNKERKRQRYHTFDPISVLSNLFCNVVPFSTFAGQVNRVTTFTPWEVYQELTSV